MEKQLAELIRRMTEVNKAQAEIERDAGLNSDGVFTDDQTKSYEALDEQYKQLEKQKIAIEKQMELVQNRADRAESLTPRILSRQSAANSGSALALTKPAGTPIEVENRETGERQMRFTIPANIKRLRPQNFHGEKNGMDAEHRAYRFGMWALATLSQCMPRYRFDAATEFVKNYMMNPTNTAHSESDAVTGGQFLVPEEFSRDLIDLREQYGVARRIFYRAPMSSDTLNIPKRATGLTAYFTAENAAATESNVTWSNVKLVAKKLTALSRMSNELSADAVISVGDNLAGEMAYAFANKEDDCAFNGTGADTYGGIQGVRTLLTSIDAAGTDSAGLSVAASASTWASVALSDLNAVVALLPQYADTPNACWVCHRAFYYGVMQRLEMAAGGAQMMELASGDRRPRPLFMGYPVEFSQIFPSTTATATVAAALGDFSKGAILGDRQSTGISFSEHATIGGENVFERGQIAIRGEERLDINVHGCGTSSAVGPIVGFATHS